MYLVNSTPSDLYEQLFNFGNYIGQRVSMLLEQLYKQDIDIQEKSPGDLITEADLTCEKLIFETIYKQKWMPECGFWGEEQQFNHNLEKDFLWVIDPLDGTNNFGIKRPTFGSSIALMYQDEVIFGAIILPINNTIIIACKGAGVVRNRKPFTLNIKPTSETRLAFVNSEGTTKGDQFCAQISYHYSHKRILRTWSPVIDFEGLFNGYISGVILNKVGIHDVAASTLIAQELGLSYKPWLKPAHRLQARSGMYYNTKLLTHEVEAYTNLYKGILS